MCKWKTKQISQQLTEELYFHITHNKVLKYWIERGRVTENNLQYIDFDTIAQASNSMNLSQKRFVTKWTSECIATGKNMKRWNFRYDGSCPFCLTSNENTAHILQCKHKESLTIWDEALISVFHQLFKLDTCPILITALRENLHAWRK